MFKFVIKRSMWLRGEVYSSYLLRASDSKMCCLGFLALASSDSEKYIRGIALPRSVPECNFPKGILKRNGEHTQVCDKLLDVNDESDMLEPARELKIAQLFKRIHIHVQFVD